MKAHSLVLLAGLALAGCSPTAPVSPLSEAMRTPDASTTRNSAPGPTSARIHPGRPDYEPAYVDGQQVTINSILVPPRAPAEAQADFYLVVYPIGFEDLGLGTPHCNPCDHFGDGIDFTDFHDHVLDSMPGSATARDFSPLWHVFAVVPAYDGQAGHDAQLNAAYAAHMPARSEAAVEELLAARLPDGSPVAVRIDKNFYFVCSVVNVNAAP